jgi:flagellar FliL protein
MTATAIRPEAADATAADGKKKDKGKKKGKKKLIIALVAVLAIGGGAYKFLMPKKVGPPAGGDVVVLDPNTVNLTNGYLLQVAVAIQLVKGKATATNFETSHAAELVLDEYSGRTVASLATATGRQELKTDLENKIKAAYPGEVYDLFITKFVTGTQQ